MSEPDRFLARWSRRKRAARQAENSAGAAPPATADPALPEAPLPSGTEESPRAAAVTQDAPALTEAELARLPRLDQLSAESDMTMFMRAGVPEPLRNAALRRAWSLDPKIRDYVSEAREYAYDWNVPGDLPGNGPLPPDFDVKALVGRLFQRRAATALPDQVAAPQQTPASARAGETATPDDTASADSPGFRKTESSPPDQPSPAAAPPATPLHCDSGSLAPGVAPAEATPQPLHHRRHGGAIPL
ncbi:MAG: DUF3306 domain-containing protein [Acetobacteraceae bacterium]